MKWLAIVALLVYTIILTKVSCAWAPALGGFGAFCTAIVVVTACVVGFGSLTIALVVATFMHVKEALFRRGKAKQMGLRKESND